MNPLELFPLTSDEIMLDNGASTPPFNSVLELVNKVLLEYGSIHRGFGKRSLASTKRYEEAREYIINRMGGDDDYSLFFVSNTTDGINRIALILQEEAERSGRDTVVVSEIEHSANLLPYVGKFRIKQVKVTGDYQVNLKHLDEILDREKDRILAVSFAGASNVTGHTLDIKSVRELINIHDKSIRFVIDASQYAPHHKIDLSDADLWTFSGHKMYAPFGIGVVAGKRKLLENMKYSFKGGGNVRYIYPDLEPLYKPVPFNQEIGTPNYVGAVALKEAVRMLYEEIGFDVVHRHEKEVYEKLINVLSEFKFIKILHSKSPIVLIEIDKPKEEVEEFFYKNNINARMGHFCVFRFIEMLKGLKPFSKNETPNLSHYNVIRLSIGLPTSLEQIDKLYKVFKRWS